jgi:hypothetical protein
MIPIYTDVSISYKITKHDNAGIDLVLFCFKVFNATFNNISAISWRSVLLVEETVVSRENH